MALNRCWKLLALVSAVLILPLAGCGSRNGERAYENSEWGFRFIPPAGWSERSRLDAVTTAGERLLVQYKRLKADHPAWLNVGVADVPASESLTAWLSKRSLGRDWRRGEQVEPFEVNGLPAARVTFAGRQGKLQLAGELVGVRVQGQIFLFSALYPVGDDKARQQVQQAIHRASWKEAMQVASR
jgi:hypothetical protein